jgi:hypothetical protein
MIRYRMPSGSFRWYITDSRKLGQDGADLYYTSSYGMAPPTDGTWRVAKNGLEPVPRMRAVRGPPRPVEAWMADASPIGQLVERHTARLGASGVEVASLRRPLVPQGALASVEVRTGRFVDRIVLEHHESAEGAEGHESFDRDSTLASGDSTLHATNRRRLEEPIVTPFELHAAEAIVGVCHWSSADYLGSQIEILTSEGRTCTFKGSRSSR